MTSCQHTHRLTYRPPPNWKFRVEQCVVCGDIDLLTSHQRAYADDHLTLTPECARALRQAFRNTPYLQRKLENRGIPRDRIKDILKRMATPTDFERSLLASVSQLIVVVT